MLSKCPSLVNDMKLTRVYPDETGKVSFPPDSYGLQDGIWYVRLPGCHLGSLQNHTVVEHEDGTITVSPSVLHRDFKRLEDERVVDIEVHGFIERGVWRAC